jgi:mono/diheme cytochrome c family protein
MLISRLALGVAIVSGLLLGGGAWADTAAGKGKFNAMCGQCHNSADFEGDSPSQLADTLRKIVGGQMPHKKSLQLSDQEIADIATYMSTGGK